MLLGGMSLTCESPDTLRDPCATCGTIERCLKSVGTDIVTDDSPNLSHINKHSEDKTNNVAPLDIETLDNVLFVSKDTCRYKRSEELKTCDKSDGTTCLLKHKLSP